MNYNYNSGARGAIGIYDGRNCSCGNREASLALAIASVPMQQWQMTYSADKALTTGTMFAELDLPFLGGGNR